MCMYTSLTSNFQIRLLHLKYIRLRTRHTLHSLNGEMMWGTITAINLPQKQQHICVPPSLSVERAFLAECRVLMKSNDRSSSRLCFGLLENEDRLSEALGRKMSFNETKESILTLSAKQYHMYKAWSSLYERTNARFV